MDFIRTVPAVRYGLARVSAPKGILSPSEIVVNREIAIDGNVVLQALSG